MGGLTIDENLITVCNECHASFDPHYRPELFWLPDGQVSRALERHSTDAHNQGVQAYRRISARVFEARSDSGWFVAPGTICRSCDCRVCGSWNSHRSSSAVNVAGQPEHQMRS